MLHTLLTRAANLTAALAASALLTATTTLPSAPAQAHAAFAAAIHG